MTYRFEQAAVDLGRARGPRLALCVHMAEGGGTVEFLSKPNRDSVSVHYVIRYTGEIVQMLDESHMHSSLRTSAIRTDDDKDGFYGRSAALAVLGKWADTKTTLGPNHATLAVEIEGFALPKDGPTINPKQAASLERLVDDLRTRYPSIALLGHRDFQNYKPCPGHLIPWDRLGGHGTPAEGDMQTTVTVQSYPPRTFTTKAGLKTLRRFNATAELAPITALPYSAKVDADVTIEQSDNRVPHGPGFLRMAGGGSAGFYILAAEVDLAPLSDPVTAALDHVRGPAQAVLTAIDEATPR